MSRVAAQESVRAKIDSPQSATKREFVLTEEFKQALELLGGRRHLFLTGKAGTGKSTLIRRFMSSTDRKVVVVAPTGVAALNVDGYTIHRLFGFMKTTALSDVCSGGYRPTRFARTLSSLDTLIIDEASMVRADLFDMLAAALERYGPQPGTPFGGVQIVLVGDLYQLPPVVTDPEAEFFSTRYQTPYFFSADYFRREDFPTIALTTVFRQLGDDRMTSILNEIREGVLVGHAQEQLNARCNPDFSPPDDEFWLTLAPTNRVVDSRNRQALDRLPGDEFVHRARLSGDLSLFDPPVAEELQFKVGAQIMMLTNDPSGSWVNGTIGRVTGIDSVGRELAVGVEFNEGGSAEISAHTWEATRPIIEGGSLRHEVIGTFTQLPFKLAWAITIHKSQGQTVDRLVVDLSGGTFDFGQLYVALSRCTSMNGLILKRPVQPKDLKTDRRIVRFLRQSVDGGQVRRHCAIGILAVGDESRLARPRPVELAVAFDDGTAVSTLINPQRDLGDARKAYGIAASDVLLAPTLAQAWVLIAPMLAGWTPVGVGIDDTLGLIDSELKRLGYVTSMPLGLDLARNLLHPNHLQALEAASAQTRASAVLQAFSEVEFDRGGSTPFDDPDTSESSAGHLLSRNPEIPTPTASHLPALSALFEVSRSVGEILLGTAAAEDAYAGLAGEAETPWLAAARHSVADQLRAAASRAPLTDEILARLREAEKLLGVSVVDPALESPRGSSEIAVVLVSGARVCFTGTAQTASGRIVAREEMENMASAAGLEAVKSVTKSKCEVLITAELGTQSTKARDAQKWGKPVFSADEFFTWLEAAK